MLERLVVADDLSGAAESAATFLLRTTRIQVQLSDDESGVLHQPGESVRVVVLDSDTRHCPQGVAGDTVARYAVRALGASRSARVVKKVDSLLRGNLASEVGALASALDATAVIATALPSARRTVVNGVPMVEGVPLAATDLWAAEDGPAPESVSDVLTGLDHVTIALEAVRDPALLRGALVATAQRGLAAVCDAETDADLDAVVAAVTVLRNPLLVGSAALVAADARQLTEDRPAPAPTHHASAGSASTGDGPDDHVVVAVIGSAATGIAEQVGLLEELGLPVLHLDPSRLLESPQDAAARAAGLLSARGLVLALDPSGPVDPLPARQLTAALATAAAPASARATVLLATGGETARAVLDSLGVRSLTPLSSSGAVVTSSTPDGLVVLTRPGSHGASASSLRDALAPFVQRAAASPAEASPTTDVPLTGTP